MRHRLIADATHDKSVKMSSVHRWLMSAFDPIADISAASSLSAAAAVPADFRPVPFSRRRAGTMAGQ
jgi:hypothetical protein